MSENNKANMCRKMNLAESAIVTLMKDLTAIEMVAIYSMISGIEFPETVTKIHLAKIIHTLCQKLGWITDYKTDPPTQKDDIILGSVEEDQPILKDNSCKDHPELDPIRSDEQNLNVTRETDTDLGDPKYESFIEDDGWDARENLEEKLGSIIIQDHETKLGPEKETQNKKKTTKKGPPPQVCIDTLTDLIEKHQPMSINNPREQGNRWDAVTLEYSRLRPNFNGHGEKNKTALKNVYLKFRKKNKNLGQRVTKTDDDCSEEDLQNVELCNPMGHLSSDSDQTKLEQKKEDSCQKNIDISTNADTSDDKKLDPMRDNDQIFRMEVETTIATENSLNSEPIEDQGYEKDNELTKARKSTKEKGPPPQVCIDTLNNLIHKYQPMASNNTSEQGNRWNAIALEYAELRPDFNVFGQKNKKALKYFYWKQRKRAGVSTTKAINMTSSKSFMCFTCGASFTSSDSLRQHEQSHIEDNHFCCSHCGKTFSRLRVLRQHETVHTGEKTYTCSHCEKKFLTKGNKECHEKIHSSEKPYSCSKCDMKFKRTDHLKRHETTSHPIKK